MILLSSRFFHFWEDFFKLWVMGWTRSFSLTLFSSFRHPSTCCKELQIFEKFVVCSKCATLYHLDECLERKHETVIPKKCSNILFPLGKAKHCNTKLVNKVILKNGITRFYPLKVYCWKSIISQLESILQRERFPDLCEHWRSRQVKESVLSDMYDGEV